MTKEERDYCREHGYCVRCGTVEADEGYRTCLACRMQHRENKRMCYHKQAPEKKKKASESRAQCLRAKRAERKEAGLCARCGKHPPETGKVQCSACLAKDRRWHIKSDRKKGVLPRYMFGDGVRCYLCGARVEVKGKKVCDSCYQKLCKNLERARAVSR